jgi:hypothetical protein
MLAAVKRMLEPAKCSEMFDNLARRLFGHNQKTASSLITRLKKYFRCWILDGVYDPVIFEDSLKETFGSDRRLFSTSEGQISGSKAAVITASIPSPVTRHDILASLMLRTYQVSCSKLLENMGKTFKLTCAKSLKCQVRPAMGYPTQRRSYCPTTTASYPQTNLTVRVLRTKRHSRLNCSRL